jgi:catechol 2,3-dioxygenase-like lactoylglutathione lyase family enzyme
MVTRRAVTFVFAALAVAAALAYLRDPPWLISQTTGLRRWEQPPGLPRFRWSGGHASFFVRADAGSFNIPVSTTFGPSDDRPMMVTISVDDETAARVVLTDEGWRRIRIALPPPGGRKVRRIDVRTSVTRDDNHGVRLGELEYP